MPRYFIACSSIDNRGRNYVKIVENFKATNNHTLKVRNPQYLSMCHGPNDKQGDYIPTITAGTKKYHPTKNNADLKFRGKRGTEFYLKFKTGRDFSFFCVGERCLLRSAA